MHGYLSSKEAFLYQIEYFSKFYRVTAVDFLGFGQSGALSTPFSVGDYAAWLKGVLLGLGVQKPHVIAHSFGCRVAVKLASEDNEFFDKLLLTGPAGVILRRGFGYHCKVKTYRFIRKFAPRFAEKRFGSAEYKTLSPIMKESYKKIVNEDLRGCAKRVQNEVLLVVGDLDTTTPIREAQAYLNSFPNAKMRGIGGGHFAFVDDPLTFNIIAEGFFYE